jgi:hypothetical protein
MRAAGLENFAIYEAGNVGESLRQQPVETEWVTPSYYGNDFMDVDLNALNPHSSPAYITGAEHPTGVEYEEYLKTLRAAYTLPVHEHTPVMSIVPAVRWFGTGDGKVCVFGR